MEEDLSLLSRYLWQQRVPHRIFEERGQQVVEVSDERAADPVRKAYRDWRAGTLVLEYRPPTASPDTEAGNLPRRLGTLLARYPVLSALILISLGVFPFSALVTNGELSSVVAWLTVIDLRQARPLGWDSLLTIQIWRWFTPMFLHFSVMHIAFNIAVSTEFGRRIEVRDGSVRFLLVVLVIAGVSNLGQFLLAGNPVFGGLSGVGYGLLGYVLVRHRLEPDENAWQVHMGFAWSLLIFLVLFSTGVTEPFGLYVANAAHWLGLITGSALGWFGARYGGRR
jgi:GlpG protein